MVTICFKFQHKLFYKYLHKHFASFLTFLFKYCTLLWILILFLKFNVEACDLFKNLNENVKIVKTKQSTRFVISVTILS